MIIDNPALILEITAVRVLTLGILTEVNVVQ